MQHENEVAPIVPPRARRALKYGARRSAAAELGLRAQEHRRALIWGSRPQVRAAVDSCDTHAGATSGCTVRAGWPRGNYRHRVSTRRFAPRASGGELLAHRTVVRADEGASTTQWPARRPTLPRERRRWGRRECREGPRAQHSQPMLERFIGFGYGSSGIRCFALSPAHEAPPFCSGCSCRRHRRVAGARGRDGSKSRARDRACARVAPARATRRRTTRPRSPWRRTARLMAASASTSARRTAASACGRAGAVEICANDQGNRITPSARRFRRR